MLIYKSSVTGRIEYQDRSISSASPFSICYGRNILDDRTIYIGWLDPSDLPTLGNSLMTEIYASKTNLHLGIL